MPQTATAAVPSIIGYQGRLSDASGNLLGGTGTTYYVKFSLWTNPTVGNGTQVWPSSGPTSFPVTVRSGVFTAQIGDTANGFPHALDYDFANNTDVYLQVEVSSDNTSFQTLSPRQRVSATPFARVAASVSGSSTPSSFGTTSPFGTSVISVEATSTQSTGISIRGILGQIAKLFRIQNSAGTDVFTVDADGDVDANTLNITSTTATSTFANGIAVTGGCISVNGSCITGGGGSGITTLNGLVATSQTFATSSDTNIGLTITSSGSAHTFTSTWSGVLASGRGGTGISSVTANQLLVGNTSGTGWTQVATSTLGINFTDLIGSATDGQVSDALTISG
ncbi:MAG: hypothetical protein AAB440_01010, partial [Patescibacteria group bacterium]